MYGRSNMNIRNSSELLTRHIRWVNDGLLSPMMNRRFVEWQIRSFQHRQSKCSAIHWLENSAQMIEDFLPEEINWILQQKYSIKLVSSFRTSKCIEMGNNVAFENLGSFLYALFCRNVPEILNFLVLCNNLTIHHSNNLNEIFEH